MRGNWRTPSVQRRRSARLDVLNLAAGLRKGSSFEGKGHLTGLSIEEGRVMKNIFVGQRRLSSLVAAGGLLIFLASQVALGSVTGSISGAVKDPSGAVVPEVGVTVVNTETGIVQTTRTNSQGYYAFPSLPVGHYYLEVRHPGFKDYKQAGLILDVNTAIDMPNYTPGNLQYNDPRSGQSYFNTSLFSVDGIGQLGTAAKRFFHGPALNNWDLALLKETHITESKVLQFRFEGFNVFNHAQFGTPVGNFSSGLFGYVTTAKDPRIAQIALKLVF
jgi:hypothetical protein